VCKAAERTTVTLSGVHVSVVLHIVHVRLREVGNLLQGQPAEESHCHGLVLLLINVCGSSTCAVGYYCVCSCLQRAREAQAATHARLYKYLHSPVYVDVAAADLLDVLQEVRKAQAANRVRCGEE
jgi:hypothetical protein